MNLSFTKRQIGNYCNIVRKRMKASIYCKTFELTNEGAQTKSHKRNGG